MHLVLLRVEGLTGWIGLLVVVQNIFTSLFNSLIFDFRGGWMYVLGVGVAGGTLLQAGLRPAANKFHLMMATGMHVADELSAAVNPATVSARRAT
jgi:hypothetical protein